MGKFHVNYRSRNSKNFPKNNAFKKKKKEKLSLQFDEEKRVKDERRKRAKEEILENLKMEKKRIKQKKAEQLQKHLAECAEAVAAVENRFGAVESTIVELPSHTVTITEFDAQPSFGLNKGNGAQEEKSTDLKKQTKPNVVKSRQSKEKKRKQAKR